MDVPEPIFLSAPKAAMLCGVTRNTVCTWIRENKLSSYRTAGGKNLIRPVDLISFMEKHHMFVPPALVDMARQDEVQTREEVQDERTTSKEPAILIVDDDKNSRELALRSLKELGMPFIEAESGYEALHLLTQHPDVSLILLDVVMPGQRGDQTLKEIRQQNLTMPVIVVSGQNPEELKEAFGPVPPEMVVTKPYDPSELLRAAQSLVSEV